MDYYSKFLPTKNTDKPVIPLPNPGEGGPVAPGPVEVTDGTPVIPLPNPGEGGPVAPGPVEGIDGIPVIPLPNPGEGGPVAPGPVEGIDGIPVIPLPNPGEGGPTPFPSITLPGGVTLPGVIGTIITTIPKPNSNCDLCQNILDKTGFIRFLNAAADFEPFRLYFDAKLVDKSFRYSEMTDYMKAPKGEHIITVMGSDGYIYVQKAINVPIAGSITVAIINTATGLDLEVIAEVPCSKAFYTSCIRVINLSYLNESLNVVIGDNYVTFNNVYFREVTNYKNIWPGEYNYYVSQGTQRPMPRGYMPEVLVTSNIAITANVRYSIYIFNWDLMKSDAIRVLVVEERNPNA